MPIITPGRAMRSNSQKIFEISITFLKKSLPFHFIFPRRLKIERCVY